MLSRRARASPPTPDNVLGVLSLIFWALVIVITGKYVSYVMRADNHGEGGIMALMAQIPPTYKGPQSRGVLLGLGLFGAALLYGDGVITPAITVLGAVEGLSTATPAFDAVRRAALGGDPAGALPACSTAAPPASARCSAR